MGGKVVTNFFSLRRPNTGRKLQKINRISPPFDNRRGMEEFRIQIFVSKSGFPRFVTPKSFLLKKEIV
jgi:hypothetical protein